MTSAVELSDGAGSATCGEHISATGKVRALCVSLPCTRARNLASAGCGDDDGDTSNGQGPSAAATTGTDENTTDENTTVDEGEAGGDRGGSVTGQGKPSRDEFMRAADRICTDSRTELASSGDELQEVVRQLQQGKIDEGEYYRRSGNLTAEFAALAGRAIDEIAALPRPKARRGRTRGLSRRNADAGATLRGAGRGPAQRPATGQRRAEPRASPRAHRDPESGARVRLSQLRRRLTSRSLD